MSFGAGISRLAERLAAALQRCDVLQTTAKFIQLNNFLAFYTFEVVLTPHLLLYSIHYAQPIIIQSSELILRLLTLKIPVWRIMKIKK